MEDNCNDIFSEIVEKANEYLLEDLDEKAHSAIEKAIMDILNKYANGNYTHGGSSGGAGNVAGSASGSGPVFINASAPVGYIDSETPRVGRMISPQLVEQILRSRRPASPSLMSENGGDKDGDLEVDLDVDGLKKEVDLTQGSLKTEPVIETDSISPTNQSEEEEGVEKEEVRRKRSFLSRLFGKKKAKDTDGSINGSTNGSTNENTNENEGNDDTDKKDEEKKTKIDKLIEKEDAVNAKLNKALFAFLLNTPGIAQVSMGRNLRQTVLVNNDQKPIPVVLVTDLNRSKSRETRRKERKQKQDANNVDNAEIVETSVASAETSVEGVESVETSKTTNKPMNVLTDRDVLELVENPPNNKESSDSESKDDSWSSSEE